VKPRPPGFPQSLTAEERHCVLDDQVKFSAAARAPQAGWARGSRRRVAVRAGGPLKNGVFYGGTAILPLACVRRALQDIRVSSRPVAPNR